MSAQATGSLPSKPGPPTVHEILPRFHLTASSTTHVPSIFQELTLCYSFRCVVRDNYGSPYLLFMPIGAGRGAPCNGLSPSCLGDHFVREIERAIYGIVAVFHHPDRSCAQHPGRSLCSGRTLTSGRRHPAARLLAPQSVWSRDDSLFPPPPFLAGPLYRRLLRRLALPSLIFWSAL